MTAFSCSSRVGSAFALFSALCLTSLAVRAGELKVDINRDSKNTATETETGYTRWSADSTGGAASGLNAVTKTFTTASGETVTVSFAQTAVSQSRGGTGLLSNWYQAGAQGTAKLVSDGLTVAPANLATGGQIQMTITGLSAGHHTLLTYHNAWDSPAALISVGPMDIYLNGVLTVSGLQPTIRAATNNAAPIAYLEFDVDSTSAVTTVLFASQTGSSAAVKNVMINGFEIDTPNSTRVANTPLPANTDEHIDADTGTATLSWAAALAGSAVSHDVYFGTDKSAVQSANRNSPEYKGNQSGLSYNVSGLNSHLTYYWRVDEIDAVGNITKGTVWYFRPRQLAFPGAEGYGRFARGGRDGKVVHVTSVADYTSSDTPIPGTLRYAIEQETGPRTVVFDVSGLITLQSKIIINSPYITVAGQTAPGKGICVRKYTIGLSGASDVIIRDIRSRPGQTLQTITVSTYKDGTAGTPVTTQAAISVDGMGMQGSNYCIFDHCSISWTIDESFSSRSAKNITLQRTLISEALNKALHPNYIFLDQLGGEEHGFAASIGGDVGSFHHNLLAHCYGRNWSLAGGLDASGNFAGRLDLTDNIVYNWGHRATDGGAMEVNFVNNEYKPGPSTDFFYALNAQYDNFPGTQRYYFAGNIMPGHFNESNESAGRIATASTGATLPSYQNFVDAPFFPSYVTTQTAEEAYKQVLSDVGCNQPLIDDHDKRVIGETLTGTFTYRGSVTGKAGFPDNQADVGGWENYPVVARDSGFDSDGDGLPDWWEQIKGFNVHSAAGDFSDANGDPDGDGFTNLEDYLNWMAAPHVECPNGGYIDVDMSQLTRGYTASPIYHLGSATQGAIAVQPDGKTLRFTAAAGYSGLAQFDFTVVDNVGSTLTTTVGVHVIAPDDTPNFSVHPQPGTLSATFHGTSGKQYTLQTSTDLTTWTDWQVVTATGADQTIDLPAELVSGPRRFFRAVLK